MFIVLSHNNNNIYYTNSYIYILIYSADTEREEIRMRLKKRNEEDNVAFIINPEYVQNFIPQI